MWPRATADAFLWAMGAVATRGFHDTAYAGGESSRSPPGQNSGGPYMLLAIDMLNHARRGTATTLCVDRPAEADTEADAEAGAEMGGAAMGGGMGGGRACGALTFSMTAERKISAGEELTHTYDELDNAHLLMAYGKLQRLTLMTCGEIAKLQRLTYSHDLRSDHSPGSTWQDSSRRHRRRRCRRRRGSRSPSYCR